MFLKWFKWEEKKIYNIYLHTELIMGKDVFLFKHKILIY